MRTSKTNTLMFFSVKFWVIDDKSLSTVHPRYPGDEMRLMELLCFCKDNVFGCRKFLKWLRAVILAGW